MQISPTKIYLIDGVCGSGKTTAMVNYISKFVPIGSKFIVSQPSKKLCKQTAEQFDALNIPYEYITADDEQYAGKTFYAFEASVRKLAKSEEGGVIITSHSVYLEVAHNLEDSVRKNFNVFFDEIASIDSTTTMNVKKFNAVIEQHFEVMHTNCMHTYDFKIKSESYDEVKDMLDNALAKTDMFLSGTDVIAFLQTMLDDNTDKSVCKSSWNTRTANGYQLNVHSVMRPDAFRNWNSCRIMGAHAAESMLAAIWPQMGVSIEMDKSPYFQLKKDHNDLSNRKVSVYFFCGKNYSKKTRDAAGLDTRFDNLSNEVQKLFKGQASLWIANNDVNDDEWQVKNSIREKNVCHGINEHRYKSNIAFLSALNDTPAHFGYMESRYGVDKLTLQKAKAYETMYQAVFRLSLRTSEADLIKELGYIPEVKIVVGDKLMADRLCEILPFAKQYSMGQIEDAWGNSNKARGRERKEVKKSNSESTKESRAKKKVFKDAVKALNENTFKLLSTEPGVTLTYESSIFDKKNKLASGYANNWDEVKDSLAIAYTNSPTKKDENILSNFVVFDPTSPTKGKDDIQYLSGIQLDFDGGMLPAKRASMILSDFKHLLYNSFNNGKDGDLRFRIVVPFSHAVTAEIAELIWDLLSTRIKNDGWYVGRDTTKPNQSGLDMSKRCANSFYYIPCQAKAGKKWSFFDTTNWDKPILDVMACIDSFAPELPEYVTIAPVDNSSNELKAMRDALKIRVLVDPLAEQRKLDAKIAAAEAKWQTADHGTQNHAWFILAKDYARAGLTEYDIKNKMLNQLVFAHNPSERKAGLNAAVKSAISGKYNRKAA
jgi:hypothetical protein